MLGLLRFVLLALLCLVIAGIAAWGTMALWFRLPASDLVRGGVAAAFGLLGVWALVSVPGPLRWRRVGAFGLAFVALLGWWSTLVPPSEGDWSPEVARQVTGVIEGDTLTLTDFRDFEWRSEDDVTETWTTRTFDISQLETMDLFMSYWGGPAMAHMMVSFGFQDGEYLVWSVEVRREKGKAFSPIADQFKQSAILIAAGTEQDIVGLRSNIQRAKVHIFRLAPEPGRARELLEAYVLASNSLAQKPRFFNSLVLNCSATVLKLIDAIGVEFPFDWRLVVNGYFPNYLYDRGSLNSGFTIQELYELGDTTEAALADGLTRDFSDAIRVDVPPARVRE